MKKRKKNIKEKNANLFSLLSRYFILFLLGIPNLWIFYLVFTPLTVYAVYFILGIFFDVFVSGSIIIVNHFFPIEIIKACVAGSAYYLLLILNLSVPNIKPLKRMKMIFLSFLVLFIFNIIRIVSLSVIFINQNTLFETIHIIFWYFGSMALVALIWFSEVAFFKIKDIPIYSDLRALLKLTKKSR